MAGRDGLFHDLPPPRSPAPAPSPSLPFSSSSAAQVPEKIPLPDAPAGKSSLKRPLVAQKAPGAVAAAAEEKPRTDAIHDEGADAKRVRFKTIADTSSNQITDAMHKIASHIGKPAKFCKASKLAVQLMQSGSLTGNTSDLFFEILKASMVSRASVTESTLRQGYQQLFCVATEFEESFSPPQRAQLNVWNLWAQVANDFFTDDTFVFSKAANKVKQEINLLPEATASDDAVVVTDAGARSTEVSSHSIESSEADSDPFGLDDLLAKPSKKEEKLSRRREEEAATREAHKYEEELLRERREALMACLEIAAGRYRVPWAHTIIDILVKHAFDNIAKFTACQRDAIEKLWISVREQQVRRKQGKSTTGKLDVTAFERLQNQYSQAKISIRRSVGASGDRSAEQWLG